MIGSLAIRAVNDLVETLPSWTVSLCGSGPRHEHMTRNTLHQPITVVLVVQSVNLEANYNDLQNTITVPTSSHVRGFSKCTCPAAPRSRTYYSLDGEVLNSYATPNQFL